MKTSLFQLIFDIAFADDSSNASPLGIPFIVLAGAGDNQIQRAVTAFRDGAMDFLQIPSDILNRMNRRKLLRENTGLTTSIRMDDYRIEPVGDGCFDLFYIAVK